MDVKVEVNNEYALKDLLWGQGYDTFKRVCDESLGEALLSHIEELFCDCDYLPDICEINDYLAYELDEDDFIATNTFLNELMDLDTLKEYAKDLGYSRAYDKIVEAENNNKGDELWKRLEDEYSDYDLNHVFGDLDCLEVDDL